MTQTTALNATLEKFVQHSGWSIDEPDDFTVEDAPKELLRVKADNSSMGVVAIASARKHGLVTLPLRLVWEMRKYAAIGVSAIVVVDAGSGVASCKLPLDNGMDGWLCYDDPSEMHVVVGWCRKTYSAPDGVEKLIKSDPVTLNQGGSCITAESLTRLMHKRAKAKLKLVSMMLNAVWGSHPKKFFKIALTSGEQFWVDALTGTLYLPGGECRCSQRMRIEPVYNKPRSHHARAGHSKAV